MSDFPTLNKNETVKWNVNDSKVNLASLLNDPRKVRRDHDLFTKTWGETFRDLPTGSRIRRSKWVPNVQSGHFADYFSNMNDQVLRYNSHSIKNLRKTESDDLTNMTNFIVKDSTAIKTAVIAQQEREAVMKTRQALDALPKFFLRIDFDMGNPQVFASVSTVVNSDIDDKLVIPAEQQKEINSSKILQEKLNYYLDRVEMAIVRQISLQSDAFFKAMESHEELHDYLNKTLVSVQSLITKLREVKKNVADNSLQVICLQRTRTNSFNLLQRLQMMVTVHQTQPTIQLLLSTSEFAGSLDLIRTTQEVLHQELAGLQCFRHLSCQLTEMEKIIGQMMRQEMEECLCDEIHRSVTEGYICQDPHRLTAVMLGLLRQGQFEFLQQFREEIKVAVISLIRNTVLDAVEEINKDKNESLASRMRLLEFADWIVLLNQLFDNLIIFLKRIKSILDLLFNITQDSVARGNVFKTNSNKKIDWRVRKKSRLKSTPADADQEPCQNSNPFIDLASSSDPTDDGTNPFLSESEKNPFLDSPEHQPNSNGVDTDGNNPFLDELSDQNGDELMDGLTSYEDELILTAADSFIPSQSSPSKSQLSKLNLDQEHENETLEKKNDHIVSEEIATIDECDSFVRTLKDLLCWTLDFQQDRSVKFLIAKGKDGSLDKLSSSDFLKLAKAIERFTSEADEIVARTSSETNDKRPTVKSSLRGALQTQATRFVSRFHEERRNKLSLILDNEMWKQAEVPSELSRLLKNMISGKVSYELDEDNRQPSINGDTGDKHKAMEYLELDGKRFAVVGTVLILLKMVSEYCKCADDLPASTPDLVSRLHDLLILFNSRTCQLVLGAGALQLVGLKTISTKHLALASRCLQLVLHCIPPVKLHFQSKLVQVNQSNGDKSISKRFGVLRHFDHVTRDYQDHVNEVQNKLTIIVLSVVERYLSNWEVKAPVPSPTFRNICKQIVKFYETVLFLLPQDQICQILTTVNNKLKNRVQVLLLRFNVRNDGGPQHGLVTSDLTFYEANIKNLKGMESIDFNMNSVWS